MGNEMGNSNTSGLQEEENGTTQVQERLVQEAGQADGKEVENHNASLAEVKDHIEKENRVPTNVPNGATDPHVTNQTSHEREEKETEVQPPAESLKVEVKSNDTGASQGSSEMQPNSISNDSKEHEKLLGNTDGEGEKNIVPVSEDKEYQKKEINGFPFGVPKEAEDPHIVNQISDEREQGTEVLAPAKSPKFEVKTNNEAGSEVCDTQPASPSKHSKDHEIQQESNLKENLLQISDHHLKKQTSIKKGEEGTETSTSETVQSSHDPDPQEFEDSKFDQPELANIHVDPTMQDSNKSLHIHEDILGSNLNCTSEENGHAIGTNESKDMNETVVSGSNLEVDIGKDDFTVKERAAEEVSYEDRLEIDDRGEIGNDLGEKPVIKSDLLNGVGIKCNGEIPTEKNPISADSSKAESEVTFMDESKNPQIGASEATDKCIVLAAETALAEEESEPVENKPSDYLTHSCEESVKESKIASEKLSQYESLKIETERENNQEGIEDFICCGGSEDCIEEAKVAKNGGLVDEHSNDQSEASVEHIEDSQKEVEMVPESGIVSTDSALADCIGEEASEQRQLFEEMEDKTKASYGIESNTDARENGEQCISPVEQEEVSLTKAPLSLVQHQDKLQCHVMPVEEKVVRMERSDSEKLKTPFLGFLKEEEEAHIIVTPQEHSNNAAAKRASKESLNLHTKEVTATSKEKRKPRSSLFTTCMCCTTVLN